MPGPRYVTDFEFPESAGFTGSRNDRVNVRPHVRGYAKGGAVRKQAGGPVKSDESKTPKSQDTSRTAAPPSKKDTVQIDPKGSTVDTLKNQRERQMKELGLRRGGAVGGNTGTLGKLGKGSGGAKFAKGGRRYAEGGEVLGHSAVQRSLPTTTADDENGGRSELRPGFRKGGKAKSYGGPVKLAAGGLSADAKTSGAGRPMRKMKMSGGMPSQRGNSAGAPQASRQIGKTNATPQLKAHGGPVKKKLGGFLKRLVRNPIANPVGALAGKSKVGRVLAPVEHAVQKRAAPAARPLAAARPNMGIGAPVNPAMMHARGGKVSDIAQDRRMIKQAISKHVAAPKPSGHGVTKSRGGRVNY